MCYGKRCQGGRPSVLQQVAKPEIELYKPAKANSVAVDAEISATFNMDVTAVDLSGVKIESDSAALGVSAAPSGRFGDRPSQAATTRFTRSAFRRRPGEMACERSRSGSLKPKPVSGGGGGSSDDCGSREVAAEGWRRFLLSRFNSCCLQPARGQGCEPAAAVSSFLTGNQSIGTGRCINDNGKRLKM